MVSAPTPDPKAQFILEQFKTTLDDYGQHNRRYHLTFRPDSTDGLMPYQSSTMAHSMSSALRTCLGWHDDNNALDIWRKSDAHRHSGVIVSQSFDNDTHYHNHTALTLAPLRQTWVHSIDNVFHTIDMDKAVAHVERDIPDLQGTDPKLLQYAAFCNACPGIATAVLAHDHPEQPVICVTAFLADSTYISLDVRVDLKSRKLLMMSESCQYPATQSFHFGAWHQCVVSHVGLQALMDLYDA